MTDNQNKPRVAIVHYWLVGMRGGEKVIESLCNLYPDADIYTHVYEPAKISDIINKHNVYCTWISRLPRASKWYQLYLPLMPMALETLDLSAYDIVISSESGPAKGIIVNPDAMHFCYCHSPMRYIWDMRKHYIGDKSSRLKKIVGSYLFHKLRIWDVTTAHRVDHFIANSNHVSKRIEKYYRRDADVVHPPVDTSAFSAEIPFAPDTNYYLLIGEMVSYKRPDLAIEAFNISGRNLKVVGKGEELERLQKIAKPNIEFMGRVNDMQLASLYQNARAQIFPGEEDFGITPLESMASGRPVLAYKRGGLLDTIDEGITGMFFTEQNVEVLNATIDEFENSHLYGDVANACQAHAQTFSKERFELQMSGYINSKLNK